MSKKSSTTKSAGARKTRVAASARTSSSIAKTAKKPTTLLSRLKGKTLNEVYPYLLVILGFIGSLSASILTYEKLQLALNPGKSLACDLNPIVACGSVIATDQASAFGFPNPFMGMIGFGMMVAIGMAMLAGATFKRWYWIGLQVGVLFGISFATWLQVQSIYVIGALCPFCMIVWSVMIPLFVYTTSLNLREKRLVLPTQLKFLKTLFVKHPGEVVVVWFTVVILAIVEQFWYYWSTLL